MCWAWSGMTKMRARALALWRKMFSIELFALYVPSAMILGGLAAALLMRPWLDAGPVRITTYLAFFVASMLLAHKYLQIIRSAEDGKANLFLVASCYWYISFGLTAAAICYLIVARAYGFWPHWGESLTERVCYFFISGSAVGELFKAVTFQVIPTEWLTGKRVPAYILTIGRSRHKSRQRRPR